MTKAQLVKGAFAEIGIADYEFDLSPNEIQTGVEMLNAMMARWSAMEVVLGYDISATANEESGVPDIAVEAVQTGLALRLAPSYGKQVAQDVRGRANRAYRELLSYFLSPKRRELSSIPKGAGYKDVQNPYTAVPNNKYLDDPEERVGVT